MIKTECTCRLCGKTVEKLVKAHIFPRGFFNNLPQKALVESLGPDGESRTLKKALFDKEILCDQCEHEIMTPLDEYAINIIRDKKNGCNIELHRHPDNKLIIFDNIDKNKIRAFFASILWRCSLSQLCELKNISIGEKYEKKIGEDLLHWQEPNRFLYLDVLAVYLTDPRHGAFLGPIFQRITPIGTNRDSTPVNGWHLNFPNISVNVSLDQRPHPLRSYIEISPELSNQAQSIFASSSLIPTAGKNFQWMALETAKNENILHLFKEMMLLWTAGDTRTS